MTDYLVILTPGERGWGGYVPDLPGCYTAGLTREETLVNAREAIELWIEDAQSRNERVPEATSVAAQASAA